MFYFNFSVSYKRRKKKQNKENKLGVLHVFQVHKLGLLKVRVKEHNALGKGIRIKMCVCVCDNKVKFMTTSNAKKVLIVWIISFYQ